MYYPFIELGLYYQLGAKNRCLIKEDDKIRLSVLTPLYNRAQVEELTYFGSVILDKLPNN